MPTSSASVQMVVAAPVPFDLCIGVCRSGDLSPTLSDRFALDTAGKPGSVSGNRCQPFACGAPSTIIIGQPREQVSMRESTP